MTNDNANASAMWPNTSRVNHDWSGDRRILYRHPPVGALDGKVAIVTGAGRGIGRGEALALAREGATVVVNDLGTALDGSTEASPAQQVVDELAALGATARTNADDVASWDGAEHLVRSTIDEFGRLDILVNNAGVLRDQMSFKMDEDAWDAVVGVHLKGHFAPARFAAEHWRTQSKAGNEAG